MEKGQASVCGQETLPRPHPPTDGVQAHHPCPSFLLPAKPGNSSGCVLGATCYSLPKPSTLRWFSSSLPPYQIILTSIQTDPSLKGTSGAVTHPAQPSPFLAPLSCEANCMDSVLSGLSHLPGPPFCFCRPFSPPFMWFCQGPWPASHCQV